jgi:DNA repair exonuclease SbcCD ATPase subunit
MNANGCGKSLVFDAMAWGLTGSNIRGGSADDIVGKFDNHAYCRQIWKVDDKMFSIERYRNHKSYRNNVVLRSRSVNETAWSENMAKETVRKTDEYIEKIFGMTYYSFVSSCMISRISSLNNFCSAKDFMRKNILTEILNLSWIDAALNNAKIKQKLVAEKISDSNNFRFALVNDTKRCRSLINTYSDEEKNFVSNSKNQLGRLSSIIKDRVSVDIASEQSRVLKLRNKLEDTNASLEKFKKILSDNQKITEDISDLNRKRDNLSYKLETLSKDLKDQTSKLAYVSSDSIKKCEYCGSVLTKNSSEHMVNEINNRIKKIKHEIDQVKKDASSIDEEIKLNKKKIVDGVSDNISKCDSEISSLYQKISEANNRIKEEEKWDEHVSKIKKEIDLLNKQFNPWPDKIKEVKKELKTTRIRLIDIIGQINVLKDKHADLNYALTAYGPSGIKNDIISSKLIEFEDKVNQYLKFICDGDITVRLDNKVLRGKLEKISILIQDSKKLKPLEFSYWSGGEQTRISFAFELAKNSIVDPPFNVLLIDEGFDDLDASGVKRIVDLIQKEKNRKIICVSNRIDMKDIFPNTIKIILEDGCSSIVQSKN